MFPYAWKEITRRKARSTLTIVSILLSIALLVAVLSIIEFFREAMKLPFTTAGTNIAVETFIEPGPFKKIRQARHLGALPDSLIPQISQIPGVQDVVGVLLFWDYHPEDEKNPMYNCAGIDPAKPNIGPLSLAPAPGQIYVVLEGRSFSLDDKYAAIIDKRFAQAKNLKIGDRIEIGHENFEIIGLADMQGLPRVAQAEIFIPLATAKELVHFDQPNFPPDAVNMLLVKVEKPRTAEELKPQIKKIVTQATGLKPEQVKVLTAEAILPDTTGVSQLTQTMMKVLSIIIVFGVAILVMRTAVATIGERTREIGIMKALGWKNSDISKLMVLEMAIQTTLGGIIGITGGYAVAYIYASTIKLTLPPSLLPYSCIPAAAPPQSLKVSMQFHPWIFCIALVVSIVVGITAGYLAARKAASLQPAQAIRAL